MDFHRAHDANRIPPGIAEPRRRPAFSARRYPARIVGGLGGAFANGLRGAFAEVSRPRRVEVLDRRQQPPMLTFGRGGRHPQRPTQLAQQLVTLAVVAAGATRDAVLPRVTAPAAAWHDMVDGIGLRSAVGAGE